jgi:hypothetical protein
MIEGHDYTIYSNGPCGRARMYALLALITAFLTPLAQHGILVLLRRYWGGARCASKRSSSGSDGRSAGVDMSMPRSWS